MSGGAYRQVWKPYLRGCELCGVNLRMCDNVWSTVLLWRLDGWVCCVAITVAAVNWNGGERVCWMVSWCVVVKLDSRSRLHVPCGWHAVTFPGISNNSKWNVPVSFILTYRPSGVLNLHRTQNKIASCLQDRTSHHRSSRFSVARFFSICLSLSELSVATCSSSGSDAVLQV